MWNYIFTAAMWLKDLVVGPVCSPSDILCKLSDGKYVMPSNVAVAAPVAITGAGILGVNWLYNKYKNAHEKTKPKQKTLILHFDVNKTIIMEDAVSHKTRSYVIKCALAESPQYKDKWQSNLPEMTYYEYVTEHKLARYKNHKSYKERIKDEIEKFIDELQKRKHRFYSEIKQRHASDLAKLDARKTNIVPSFYKLIQWLSDQKKASGQDYRILIRTFGKDRNDIIKELREHAGLNIVPAEFDKDGNFILKHADDSTIELNTKDLSEVYDCWRTTDQHLGVQDNHSRWDIHQQNWEYGKPFPFERHPKDAISIFFDDNIETKSTSKTNIVAPYDVQAKQYVPVSDALKENSAFAVEPLKIIENDDYYINIVQAVLKKELQVQKEKNTLDSFPESRRVSVPCF